MPRYIDIELEEEKDKLSYTKAYTDYSMLKKYNKFRPAQLFDHILAAARPHDVIQHLYTTNFKDSWSEVDTLLSFYRPGAKTNPVTERVYADLIELLKHVFKKSETFINDKANIKGIKGIMTMYDERLRDIKDWKPKRISAVTQLPDLINFLFAKYYVPQFLVSGFVDNKLDPMMLFLHIGSGKSIKKFELFPNLVLSNKCFHHILTTPDYCTYVEAFRRAQILHMGGDERLFNVICDSPINTMQNSSTYKKERDEFWVTVIKFFIDNPMINTDKIPEIIDYINHEKFTLVRNNRPDGTFFNAPHQPNFTMKGRTPMSLLNHSDDWHWAQTIKSKREKAATSWEPLDIDDFKFQNGDNHYEIRQLTSTKELIEEGNRMHHCVATYASSCLNKSCSIFSFRHSNSKKGIYNASCITLEIRSKSIVQARAKYNEKPHPYHWEITGDYKGMGF